MSKEKTGAMLVIASAAAYGFLYYFGVKIIRENYSPYNVMFWRFLIASILLLLILLPRLKKIGLYPFGIRQRDTSRAPPCGDPHPVCRGDIREKINVTKKQIFLPLITNAPFHGAATSLYFLASTHIGGGPAEVLLFTHPITVLLFNRFVYGEKIARICYVAIILVICGAALLTDFGGANFNLIGIFIGVVSSIFFGLYIVCSKSNGKGVDPILSAFLVCFGSMVICLIFSLIHGSFVVPNAGETWFNIFCLGAFCTALPIMLFLKGLQFIASEKAAIISMLEPPMLILVGYLLLNEKVTAIQFLGIMIIMISTLIILTKKVK